MESFRLGPKPGSIGQYYKIPLLKYWFRKNQIYKLRNVMIPLITGSTVSSGEELIISLWLFQSGVGPCCTGKDATERSGKRRGAPCAHLTIVN